MSNAPKISRQANWLKAHPWYDSTYRHKNKVRLNKLQRARYKRSKKKIQGLRSKYRERNLGIIGPYKRSPCADCQRSYPAFIMHFDHRNPETKVSSISRMMAASPSKLLKEIAKCDVVCANCHGLRTWKAMQQGKLPIFGRYLKCNPR